MGLYNLLPKSLQQRISPVFMRYGIMAVIVVGIEIAGFWLLNSPLHINYLVATNLSLLIGILLNWVGSHYYVFGASRHTIRKEFTLVFLTSLVGVLLQTGTVYIMVHFINTKPLLGKVAAIIVTFFWNYFIRKRHIYKPAIEIY